MFAHKLPSRLKWPKFALQLGNSDHSGNEFDVLFLKKILVLSLRVFCDETYGRRARIDGRVGEGTSKIDQLLAKACVESTKNCECIHSMRFELMGIWLHLLQSNNEP